jgi:lipoprotein-releasing system ATP-binding protein
VSSDPATPVSALRLEGVQKSYCCGSEIENRVLHGIDLELAAGEFAALMGPSGSGKSTLLHIMGLLDRPTAGRVVVAGSDTADLDDRGLTVLRGRAIGFVFQFHYLLPAFTALENVMMPLLLERRRVDGDMRRTALDLLGRVGLAPFAGRPATRLSGGQQQRVAVARALASRPRLVLADEPTGNLDSASSAEVFELLRRFNREEGMAFLIVTHDRRLADRCDRVIELIDGRVTSDRPQLQAGGATQEPPG